MCATSCVTLEGGSRSAVMTVLCKQHKNPLINQWLLGTCLFPAHQISWLIDRMIEGVHNFSSWASSATVAVKETKVGTEVALGWGWCRNFEYMHSAEKLHGPTLNAEKIVCPLHSAPTNRQKYDWWHIACLILWWCSVASLKLSLHTSVMTSHITCGQFAVWGLCSMSTGSLTRWIVQQ